MTTYTITYMDNTSEVEVLVIASSMDAAVDAACCPSNFPDELDRSELRACISGDGVVRLTHADLINH